MKARVVLTAVVVMVTTMSRIQTDIARDGNPQGDVISSNYQYFIRISNGSRL